MVCADSGRSEELRHRKDIRQRALAPPTLDQFGAAVEKTWELPIERGTLCGSLGIETRDSPKGSVCSSSPRGITPLPSSGVIKYAANTIAIVDRTQLGRRAGAAINGWWRAPWGVGEAVKSLLGRRIDRAHSAQAAAPYPQTSTRSKQPEVDRSCRPLLACVHTLAANAPA